MSLAINTNVSALTALYNLNQTEPALQTAIQRLSSGLRINSAADDPAGLVAAGAAFLLDGYARLR